MIQELKNKQQVKIGDIYYTFHINNKRPSFRKFGYTTDGLIKAVEEKLQKGK